MRAFVVLAVLVVTAAANARAGNDNPELDRSSDDLLVRFGSWDGCDGWLSANRFAILAVSRRATPVAPGAAGGEAAAARTRARAALLSALSSRAGFVASAAALALGLAGDARDIPTLSEIVREGRSPRRMLRWAALGLGELPIGDAEQADEARKALFAALEIAYDRKDQFACFWANCAYALAMRGDAAAVPRLVELRRKMAVNAPGHGWTHSEVVGAVCYALGAVGGDDAVPELEAQLAAKRPPGLDAGDAGWSVAAALQRVGGEKAVRLLRNAASDPREYVRCVALQALGVASGPEDDEAAEILGKALRTDRDAACRQMAAIGLARSGHSSSAATLTKAFAEAGSAERRFVAVAIGLRLRDAPDPKLSVLLCESLERTGSQEERAALTVACGLANAQAARATIVDRLPKNRQGLPASSASFALGLLGAGPAELKLLHETVQQAVDPTARLEAALALGLLRDHSVVPQLSSIVFSRNVDQDRASAAMCLGRVGDDADIDTFLGVLADHGTSDALRACVVRGLGRLLDRREGARLARVVANARWRPQPGVVDPIADLRGLVE